MYGALSVVQLAVLYKLLNMGERVSLCQNREAAGWDGGIMCTVRIGTDYN